MDIFNKNLDSLTLKLPTFEKQTIPCDETLPVQSDTVDIFKRKYKDLVHIPLSIPNYQRIYCWEEENVK
jgi:uncharacterized protein with ParB-like and HNH nuclease domain